MGVVPFHTNSGPFTLKEKMIVRLLLVIDPTSIALGGNLHSHPFEHSSSIFRERPTLW
jgi:hypothetical protein